MEMIVAGQEYDVTKWIETDSKLENAWVLSETSSVY